MIRDRFSMFPEAPGLPSTGAFEITPDDAADLPQIPTALNVATPGSVRVTTKQGDVVTLFIAAGIFFPMRVTRVWAEGTTATGIRGLV